METELNDEPSLSSQVVAPKGFDKTSSLLAPGRDPRRRPIPKGALRFEAAIWRPKLLGKFSVEESELEQMLEQALKSECGWRVLSSDADALRRRLYVVRKKHERFACLSLHISPSESGELWITKEEART